MPLYSGLLVSTHRNREKQGMSEIHYTLTDHLDFKKHEIKVSETGVSGLITVKLPKEVDLNLVMQKIIDVDSKDQFYLHCLKIRPISKVLSGGLESISNYIKSFDSFLEGDYKIEVSKRHSKFSSDEIISSIAPLIPNKVNLVVPSWIILVEIIADKIGISLVKPEYVYSAKVAFEEHKTETENWFLD